MRIAIGYAVKSADVYYGFDGKWHEERIFAPTLTEAVDHLLGPAARSFEGDGRIGLPPRLVRVYRKARMPVKYFLVEHRHLKPYASKEEALADMREGCEVLRTC